MDVAASIPEACSGYWRNVLISIGEEFALLGDCGCGLTLHLETVVSSVVSSIDDG
jgi:hypothetical protein